MTEPMFRNRARAESFGAIAEAYDRFRPSYPPALVHELLMTDPHVVLDIGCGTGKAARLFTERGLDVLGVEIDEGMAAVARTHGLQVEVSGFEDWDDAGRRFDLAICAQAWHWVDPDRGAVKALSVLRPGGRLALFWNRESIDPTLRAAVDEVYERIAPDLGERRLERGGRDAGRAVAVGGLERAGFVGIGEHEYPWEHRYTRDEWLDLLATQSNHALLPAQQRGTLLADLGAVIDTFGGTVTSHYSVHLLSARRPA